MVLDGAEDMMMTLWHYVTILKILEQYSFRCSELYGKTKTVEIIWPGPGLAGIQNGL